MEVPSIFKMARM